MNKFQSSALAAMVWTVGLAIVVPPEGSQKVFALALLTCGFLMVTFGNPDQPK